MMSNKSIQELITFCRSKSCSITLEGGSTGVVARITANRGHVLLSTSVYLDANDAEKAEKLKAAVERVQ